ncbi:hypothetical protein CEXT_658891 [Caerostris extrusa]|uniref:Uncharacterized protein n=1 Tax=Caerostris extrusa TaxID=172846 RepID=A0AAV4NGP4_CAEEX|nr:hypothetical protein CEXT_658891 [Caerostris extrusa]
MVGQRATITWLALVHGGWAEVFCRAGLGLLSRHRSSVCVPSGWADTKNFIQKSVDITRVKIGVKKVTNVRKGGILIETVDQTDLDKLLMELDSNPEVKTNFEIGKPIQTNPQVICYGVSNETTEETVANSIKQHCSLEETSQDVKNHPQLQSIQRPKLDH